MLGNTPILATNFNHTTCPIVFTPRGVPNASHTKLQRDPATRVSTRPREHMPSGASGAPGGDFSATDDHEFRGCNLARRLCLAARAVDRPDNAAAAMARLGWSLRDGAADMARRKLKSGLGAFEAKLGSLGLADVAVDLS